MIVRNWWLALGKNGTFCKGESSMISATQGSEVQTGHQAMIHDAQLDFYSRRLATCSSDRTIKVFAVSDEGNQYLCDLQGHDSPVWEFNGRIHALGRLRRAATTGKSSCTERTKPVVRHISIQTRNICKRCHVGTSRIWSNFGGWFFGRER